MNSPRILAGDRVEGLQQTPRRRNTVKEDRGFKKSMTWASTEQRRVGESKWRSSAERMIKCRALSASFRCLKTLILASTLTMSLGKLPNLAKLQFLHL